MPNGTVVCVIIRSRQPLSAKQECTVLDPQVCRQPELLCCSIPEDYAYLVQMLNGKDGFLSSDRLKKFSKHRNDPNQPEALSNLSPYYHFGHLAAQRAALEASKLRSKAKVGLPIMALPATSCRAIPHPLMNTAETVLTVLHQVPQHKAVRRRPGCSLQMERLRWLRWKITLAIPCRSRHTMTAALSAHQLAQGMCCLPQEDVDAFLEESVVRRELSDNYCFYVPNYDSIDACYDWAKESLNKHRDDPRENVYTLCAPLPLVSATVISS